MGLDRKTEGYIESHHEEAIELLKELAVIPSPSGHEERRAEFCRAWLESHGCGNVYIDEALNVIYPIGCSDDGPVVVFMAHSDVVFPDTDELPIREEGDRLYCPGIGDDTANSVVLLMAARYIAENHLVPKDHGVLLVINSGEEGLGNLKGSRKIVADYGGRIRRFYSFDGYACNAVDKAIGSRRYRITLRTEGGHSYFDFGRVSAIHQMSSLICDLYSAELPKEGRTTFNAGVISGGTSVNTIAQECSMLYEIRSDRKESIEEMERHLHILIDSLREKGVSVDISVIGERPCASGVDPALQAELNASVTDAVRRYFGRDPEFAPASMDTNIPLSMGIPSIGIGCYEGGGMHTREEYVDTDSLIPGMKLGFDLILSCFTRS